MKINKFLIVGILVLLGSTFFLSFVSADQYILLCLREGETGEFSKCDPEMHDRTCTSTICKFCSRIKDDGAICPNVNPSLCNAKGLPCTYLDDALVALDAPIIDLVSPEESEVYDSKKILLNFSLDKEGDVSYMDRNYYRERWVRIYSSCWDYERVKSFKEGENNLTLRVIGALGNTSYIDRNFFVDSRDPRILKTNPRKGFSDGTFEVQFKETNPVLLELNYGNNVTGMRQEVLNIENDCYEERRKHYCEVDVDLDDYDGEEIEYWFYLEDVAKNNDISRIRELEVDTTFPVVNYFTYFTNGRYVTFNMSVIEENFDEITYNYIDSYGRLRERRLCSSLKDGLCVKKKSFRRGFYDLTIQIKDEAGNSIGFPAHFIIDY